ncbi:MAG: hypothetical protein JO336_24195 [Acidobacteriia bacterium]|nr:hypothetical protein [Terriglobia bacterium]MBV8906015.1 hypothetical protein [Terriglobia bacterium]
MATVHSFDVFDTCLLRMCAFPSDIFFEVGYRLASGSCPEERAAFAEDFRAARIQAERAARRKADREDTTLVEIWRELAPKIPLDDWQSGMEVELETERQHLRPNRRVLATVRAARQASARILFVSDMYLPAEFIREQLQCHGFLEPGDGLFVSSDAGVCKRSGNLFRHILRIEGIAAASLHHFGDNPVSDVSAPQALGISAELAPEAELDPCERGLLNGSLNHRHVSSKLAGRCRVFRLSGEAGDTNRSLVAAFLGPFLLTFASWVLTEARRDGIRRLYFLSRRCYLLSRMARILAPRFGIECHYLYLSCFVKALAASPVRDRLASKIEERRAQALRYFEQELDPFDAWALVDLGWRLTSQAALRLLLERPVRGYYLGLHGERTSPTEAGYAAGLFYYESGDRLAAAPPQIFGRIDLPRHLVGLAPHGTVHHYEPSNSGMVPVCSDVKGPMRELLASLERHLEQFAEANSCLADEIGDTSAARDILDTLTATFVAQPERAVRLGISPKPVA